MLLVKMFFKYKMMDDMLLGRASVLSLANTIQLGCAQNKQTKFRFEPKQTETR
jgi:hypothetical protein